MLHSASAFLADILSGLLMGPVTALTGPAAG